MSADPPDACSDGAQVADDYGTVYGGIFDASSDSPVRWSDRTIRPDPQ